MRFICYTESFGLFYSFRSQEKKDVPLISAWSFAFAIHCVVISLVLNAPKGGCTESIHPNNDQIFTERPPLLWVESFVAFSA